MRHLLIAAAAFGALTALSSAGSPAQAQGGGYPFCLIDKNTTGYGDCAYSTFEQCKISASGRAASCDRNYYLSNYGQAPDERPRRRYKRVYR